MSDPARIVRELELSRWRVEQHWSTIAAWCPDKRLAGSSLQPVEGMNGHRALDLDRRYHIDHFAVVRNVWTPVATRFQDACFADRKTVTFRQSEVKHLRTVAANPGMLGAALHVQMYGDDTDCVLIVIAELDPIITNYGALHDDRIFWLYAPDGNRFTYLTRGQLAALNALVWFCEPAAPQQLELL